MEEILFLALCRSMLPRTLAIGRQQTQARGEILIKGKGLLKTYWIIGTEHVSLPGESQQKNMLLDHTFRSKARFSCNWRP